MALFGKKKKEEKKPKAAVSAKVTDVKKLSSAKVAEDKEKKTKKTVTPSVPMAATTGLVREIIRIQQPIVSEKTMTLSSEQNQYAFVVDRDATKPEIKKQIQQRYNVEVVRVRTIRLQGKANMFRGKRSNPTPVKKAIVTVQKGQKIDIAGNV